MSPTDQSPPEEPERTRMDHCMADLGTAEMEAILKENDVFEEVALLVAVAMASIDLNVSADILVAASAPSALALPPDMQRHKVMQARMGVEASKQRWSLLVSALRAIPKDGFGIEATVNRDSDGSGTCSVCGCTDGKACPEGCSWVNEEHTLCSACAEKTEAPKDTIPFAGGDERHVDQGEDITDGKD